MIEILNHIEAEARANAGRAMTFSADRLLALVEIARTAEAYLEHKSEAGWADEDALDAALSRLERP